MSANPILDAIPLLASQPAASTRSALARAVALPLPDAAAVTAFHALDLAAAGTPYPAVIFNGSVYDYDAADTTTAHDAPGGCIVDASGRRYKRSAAAKPDYFVLDKDLTAPPGSPAQGDSYYVATAATGAWAGHDGDQAVYGARGWSFRDLDPGHILWVVDEACYYHVASGGTLTKGLGDLALTNGSIEARHLAFKMGLVVQAAQTTPPVSPTDRVCYIVTATATGAWAGQEGKVAEYDSAGAGAWLFHTPRTGDVVWDVGAGYLKYWTGSAWTRAVQAPLIKFTDWQERTGGNITLASTSNWATIVSTTITADPADWIFGDVIVWADYPNDGGATKGLSIGLFVDSEASPRASFAGISVATGEVVRGLAIKLRFHPPDGLTHAVHLKALPSSTTGNDLRILNNTSCDFQVRAP